MNPKFSLSKKSVRLINSLEKQPDNEKFDNSALNQELIQMIYELSNNLTDRSKNNKELTWHMNYESEEVSPHENGGYSYLLEFRDEDRTVLDLIVKVDQNGQVEIEGGLKDPELISKSVQIDLKDVCESSESNKLVKATKDLALNSYYRLGSIIALDKCGPAAMKDRIQGILVQMEILFAAMLDILPQQQLAK